MCLVYARRLSIHNIAYDFPTAPLKNIGILLENIPEYTKEHNIKSKLILTYTVLKNK
jgi:hypothetical protein